MSHLNINGVDKPLDHIRLNNVRSENLASSYYATGSLGQYSMALFADFDIKPDTKYTLSFDALQGTLLYTNENVFTSYKSVIVYGSRCYVTHTTKSSIPESQYFSGKGWLLLKNAATLQSDPQITNVMLSLGSAHLPYEPYLITKEAWEARTRVILHNLTNPLCGIGTYKDTLDLSTGVLTRYIKKLVLTGEEEWGISGGTISDNTFFQMTIAENEMQPVSAISSHFTFTTIAASTTTVGFYITTLNHFLRIRPSNVTTFTLETFKQWLADQYSAGTPITVWYVLATPTTETITVPSNLTGIVEGYLTQSSTPSPTSPVYPTANGTLEQGGTYSLDTGAYAIAWGRADTFTGTDPMSARCYGLPIKSWEIDGNTQQDGTPAPDNPITPEFVGERTENLFDADLTVGTINVSDGTESPHGQRIRSDFISKLPAGTYSLSANGAKLVFVYLYNTKTDYYGTTNTVWSTLPYTFTTNSDFFVRIVFRDSPDHNMNLGSVSDIMLNTGSTPIPYEPYGYAIQTYSYTQNTVSGQTPLTLTDSVGHNLISWDGEGATTSSGTPSPTSPVTVSGWGNKTENLYNSPEVSWELGILDDNGDPTGATTSHYTKNFTAVEPETAYYLSGTIYIGQSSHRIYYYDANKNWISRSPLLGYYDGNFTTPVNCKYVRFQIIVDLESTSDWMLNLGSTPLPYEPYGYKIPITSAGQTQNVYLGQAQTTRRVKKLVLTGEEGWEMSATTTGGFYLASVSDYLRSIGNVTSICTHYPASVQTVGMSTVPDKTTSFYGTSQYDRLYINDSSFASKDAFKSYLAQQYAAGTPVTVWYALAEPTIGIVNEPLMKIGDYADSITSTQARITIPTAKGDVALTTNNTVQPSIIHATYDKYISGGDAPVYLGQVLTTRRVKKLVFDGTENFNYSEQYLRFSVPIDGIKNGRTRIMRSFCSHYECLYHDEPYDNEWDNVYYQAEDRLYFHDRRFSTVVSFKQWLADQYAAGTPVTVWYILANEETSIVNEPLCKISEYADTLTSEQAGVTIPTTDGNNTISVDTTLAPSKMTITGHIRDVWFTQSITGVPPLSFKSNGMPLISLSMKGNGQQTGTPTPDNIIMPTFCGERTVNMAYDVVVGTDAGVYANALLFKADLQPSTQYKLSFRASAGINLYLNENVFELQANFTTVEGINVVSCMTKSSIDVTQGAQGLNGRWRVLKNSAQQTVMPDFTDIMFNLGSTPIPYEPYGYKLPITNAGQTVPVYLGKVLTTRKIKKLMLTGEENWTFWNGGTGVYYTADIQNYLKASGITCVCSHYPANDNVRGANEAQYGVSFIYNNPAYRLYIVDTAISTTDALKSYLAAQYAAGTPVTIWYIIAEPETAIVNEPLAKIDIYADELYIENAWVSIPTANGENTLTVDTTLSPSSVSITGYIKPYTVMTYIDYTDMTKSYTIGDVNKVNAFTQRRRCNMLDDGTITAYYGDPTFVEDGSNGQVMVYQPKFYYKVEPVLLDGIKIRKCKYYISDYQLPGYKLHPAFIDRTDPNNLKEFPFVCIGAYEGCLQNGSTYITDDSASSTSYKLSSIAFTDTATNGVKPSSGIISPFGTIGNYETTASNRGTGWHIENIWIASMNQLMFVIEMCNPNSQTALGSGVTGIPDTPNTANNSSLVGSTSSLGNGSGRATTTYSNYNGTTTAQTADNKTAVSYRGMENPFGNIWKWIDGMTIKNTSATEHVPYICKSFAYTRNSTLTNYDMVNVTIPGNGYVTAFGYDPNFDWLFISAETNSSNTGTIRDYLYTTNTGHTCALLGGRWIDGAYAGLFYWSLNSGSGSRSRNISARICYLPQ